jgi:hypothetical protein
MYCAGYALLHASQTLVQLLEAHEAKRRGLPAQTRILGIQTSDFRLKPRYFGVLGPHFHFDQMLSSLQCPNTLRLHT